MTGNIFRDTLYGYGHYIEDTGTLWFLIGLMTVHLLAFILYAHIYRKVRFGDRFGLLCVSLIPSFMLTVGHLYCVFGGAEPAPRGFTFNSLFDIPFYEGMVITRLLRLHRAIGIPLLVIFLGVIIAASLFIFYQLMIRLMSDETYFDLGTIHLRSGIITTERGYFFDFVTMALLLLSLSFISYAAVMMAFRLLCFIPPVLLIIIPAGFALWYFRKPLKRVLRTL